MLMVEEGVEGWGEEYQWTTVSLSDQADRMHPQTIVCYNSLVCFLFFLVAYSDYQGLIYRYNMGSTTCKYATLNTSQFWHD